MFLSPTACHARRLLRANVVGYEGERMVSAFFFFFHVFFCVFFCLKNVFGSDGSLRTACLLLLRQALSICMHTPLLEDAKAPTTYWCTCCCDEQCNIRGARAKNSVSGVGNWVGKLSSAGGGQGEKVGVLHASGYLHISKNLNRSLYPCVKCCDFFLFTYFFALLSLLLLLCSLRRFAALARHAR